MMVQLYDLLFCNSVMINKKISYFFTAVRWQVERQDREERDAHARYDNVDRVKKRFPSHGDVERYVQIRFIAARIDLFVPIKHKHYIGIML